MVDTLREIRVGNICSLCEKSLNWTSDAKLDEEPRALGIKRAICRECFETLKTKYGGC